LRRPIDDLVASRFSIACRQVGPIGVDLATLTDREEVYSARTSVFFKRTHVVPLSPPVLAWLTWHATPGTLGSSKALIADAIVLADEPEGSAHAGQIVSVDGYAG
jgi:catabolite regulation protein CreA